MTFVVKDRVADTSTFTGSPVNVVVAGNPPPGGYRTFSSVCSIGDTFPGSISGRGNNEFVVGTFKYVALNTISLVPNTIEDSSNGGAPVTFSSGIKDCQIVIPATRALAPQIITAARTYYVRKDGDDANSGLIDHALGAFLTVMRAVDVASQNFYNFHLSAGPMLIRIRGGVYDEDLQLGDYSGMIFSGNGITIEGNPADKTDVVIRPTTAVNSQGIISQQGGIWTIGHLTIDDTGIGHFSMLDQSNGGIQYFYNIKFIGRGNSICVDQAYGTFSMYLGGCEVVGGFRCFLSNTYHTGFVFSGDITLTDNPNFSSSFIDLEADSTCHLNYFPVTGTCTGRRFTLYDHSFITTDPRFPVSPNPGDIPGSIDGIVDETSGFHNVFGLRQFAGLPTNTLLARASWGIFRDTVGGDAHLAYDDAGDVNEIGIREVATATALYDHKGFGGL